MAAIQTLGIAGMFGTAAPAGRPASQGPDLAEYGASGTPIFGGFLRERGEYNPNLQGLQAISTYEEMRRSDGQVAATLMAMKLPLRAAQWDVMTDADATPVEQEAGDFTRQCFFKDLDFSAVLRNALLMLDFGVAVHEDVYEVVGNRVRLKKLAARLPLTFYRWIASENGEDLAALEQLGYRGSEYICAQVPVEKISIFTFEQEGQNYTGRSLMRPMYQHWYFKQGLYKVDAISCERNGSGVPTIIMGPDAKREDIATAKTFVEQLTAHERTGLVLPHEWTFKLEGVSGTLRDPKDSIAHHNMMISMSAMEMFMMLGQTHGGNRALGDTMADFFYLGLDATALMIERVLNQTTVKRLVDFNFPGVKRYPRIKCQQILTVKFEGIVSALKDLATAGVIEPDEPLEAYMREKMGAPPLDKSTARVGGGISNKPSEEAPGAGGEAAPGAAAGDGGGKPAKGATGPAKAKPSNSDGKNDPPLPAGKAKVSQIDRAAGIIKQAMVDAESVYVDSAMGGVWKREPGSLGSPGARRAELCMAFSDIAGGLDKGRNDVAAALRGARPRVQAEIVHKLVDAPVRTMHRVSVAPDDKLIADVEGILRGVAGFGAGQVAKERERQRAGAAPSDAARIRMTAARAKGDTVGLYADAVVSEFQNGLTARGANIALDKQRKGGLGKGELINEIQADLNGQSDKWLDNVASKGASEAFAEGRSAGYEEHADEIASVIYSAMLDINCCETCADADGEEGTTPEDIPDVPNPDCDGGDKCRCVHVYVFSDEGGTT